MFTAKFFYIIFVISFGYFLILTFYYLFLVIIGSYENVKKALEREGENYPLLYFSTFKMPVSIIMPAHNEEEWIEDSLKSLLNLNYPEFEIIVVNDDSSDRTLEILDRILKLKPVETIYIKHYKDGDVRNILKSEKYPYVTVIDKTKGLKKAGAANAGLNIAKYDHICVIDADTILEQNALLVTMAHVEKEPDKVVGIGSSFGLVNGFKIKEGRIAERSFSYNPLIAYQNLEYIRSFIGNRIAWSRFNAMPTVAGGFGIWRKDVLYELGGFSVDYTCEDIELTFRVHDYIANNKDKGYKIIMLPYYMGWTEGPSTVRSLIMQRNRWQRVTNETAWHYKYMMCNPKYGGFAFLTLPYFVMYEVLGVFVEIFSIAVVAIGGIAGLVDFKIFIAFFLFMLLSQGIVSLFSILAFVQDQRFFRPRYILYLVALTFVEFFWYRWIISIAKISGTYSFLRRVKSFDQYTRAKRTQPA
ncbi:MAG: glycosyltransferase [Candidatus Omnitrophica bacterium]|nr:glycosyltransferase [Candidatus Omnitrophota bacterium]